MIKVCIDPMCEEVAHNCTRDETRCRNCGGILVKINDQTYKQRFLNTCHQIDYSTGKRLITLPRWHQLSIPFEN